ncbi:MAG TPA: addiction module protein [Gammaproteobacteria bacterium]|nr:addiction module protein [Gammaproteobacteria bacterium]
MARPVHEIEKEIRLLSIPDRDQLLRDIIADINGESDRDVEAAWIKEAQARYQQLKEGVVEPVPVEEVIRKARHRLNNGH